MLAARTMGAGPLGQLTGGSIAPPLAAPMQPAARGPPPEEPPPPAGKMTGTAKRFDMERGFGFIVPDDGGEDIFAHGSALTDGNALREGARVCFRKTYDPVKNKAAAEEVTGAYIDPMRAPPRGMGPVPPGMGGAPRGPPLGEPAPPPGKMMGTTKRFNMETGFGFIIPDGGGDDIFVHAMNITDGNALREGARVCFKTGVDERKNKAHAKEVTGGYVDPSRPGFFAFSMPLSLSSPPGAASRGGMPPMPRRSRSPGRRSPDRRRRSPDRRSRSPGRRSPNRRRRSPDRRSRSPGRRYRDRDDYRDRLGRAYDRRPPPPQPQPPRETWLLQHTAAKLWRCLCCEIYLPFGPGTDAMRMHSAGKRHQKRLSVWTATQRRNGRPASTQVLLPHVASMLQDSDMRTTAEMAHYRRAAPLHTVGDVNALQSGRAHAEAEVRCAVGQMLHVICNAHGESDGLRDLGAAYAGRSRLWAVAGSGSSSPDLTDGDDVASVVEDLVASVVQQQAPYPAKRVRATRGKRGKRKLSCNQRKAKRRIAERDAAASASTASAAGTST